jgi:hypothetical protein
VRYELYADRRSLDGIGILVSKSKLGLVLGRDDLGVGHFDIGDDCIAYSVPGGRTSTSGRFSITSITVYFFYYSAEQQLKNGFFWTGCSLMMENIKLK